MYFVARFRARAFLRTIPSEETAEPLLSTMPTILGLRPYFAASILDSISTSSAKLCATTPNPTRTIRMSAASQNSLQGLYRCVYPLGLDASRDGNLRILEPVSGAHADDLLGFV